MEPGGLWGCHSGRGHAAAATGWWDPVWLLVSDTVRGEQVVWGPGKDTTGRSCAPSYSRCLWSAVPAFYQPEILVQSPGFTQNRAIKCINWAASSHKPKLLKIRLAEILACLGQTRLRVHLLIEPQELSSC